MKIRGVWLVVAGLLTAFSAQARQSFPAGLASPNGALAKLPALTSAQVRASLARPAAGSLSDAARAAAAQQVLKTSTTPVLGATVSLKPASPYKAGVALSFTDAMLVAASASGGAAVLTPASNDKNAGEASLSFQAAAGKPYLIDCQVAQDLTIQWSVFVAGAGFKSKGTVSSLGKHVTFAMPGLPGGGDVTVSAAPIDGGGALIVTGCDLTPVG